VEGEPEPDLYWLRNGRDVGAEEDEVFTSYRNGVARLRLRDVQVKQAGEYVCKARNDAGVVQCSSRVTVKGILWISMMSMLNSCCFYVPAKPVHIRPRFTKEIPPEFTAPLSDVKSKDGDDVCLRCMVTGIPEPTVQWMFNNEILEPEEGLEITFHEGVAALMLEQATDDDTGTYTCVAVNCEGECTTSCRVVVTGLFVRRVAPSFEKQLPQEVVVEEGKEACFECEVGTVCTIMCGYRTLNLPLQVRGHPQPRVKHQFESAKQERGTAEDTFVLHGTYRAKRNRHPLTTQPPPYNPATPLQPSHPPYNRATPFTTAPPPYNRATPLQPRHPLTTAPPPYNRATPLQPRHPPLQPRHPLKTTTPPYNRATHSLSCHVTGTPTPEVSWKVDGQRLEPEDGEVGFKAGVATLVLDDVMKEDTGRYECVATNEAGSASSGCNVTVQATPVKSSKPVGKEPSFPLLLEDLTVEEGDDIVLRCKVVGMPRPKITWLLDGEAILDADLKYEEDGSAQLVLSEALPEDEGVYTCIAENPLKRVMCSCKVTIAGDDVCIAVEEDSVASPSVETMPSFVKKLEDRVIPDGSSNVTLSCVVEGGPDARWMIEDELIEDGEDFRYISDGNIRGLLISEVFPEDSGVYSCVISNTTGESRCSCKISVEEIEGETPTFLMKPKPVSVNAGERAFFSCRVDGDPPPSIQWLFCNQPIIGSDRITITEADPSNNHTHSLEIPQVSPQDAGRYAVCCRNLLGDVTCTVSLIVSDAKKLEIRKDFRSYRLLCMGYRALCSSGSERHRRADRRTRGELADDTGTAYKEALSTSVKTKAMTEEERKRRKAEQLDFRANLVRKVDTKVALQDRTKTPEQQDFREEALKTRVRTKALGQDDLKYMSPEQKDFRGEAIKSKVVTKAYKEELIKTKRAEQVDFRDVLSPTRKAELDKKEESISIAELPRGKWRKDGTDHTTVATKRSRHKGAAVVVPVRRVEENGRESEEEKEEGKEEREEKPQFTKFMDDVEASDGQPFTLECTVTGEPRPEITWYLDEEEVKAEADISITYEGDICRLSIAESFPDDQGKYSCTARNIRGEATCSAFVTVVADGESARRSSSKSEKNIRPKTSIQKPTSSTKQPFVIKKKISPTSGVAACIKDGPRDMTVLRGNPISLCCALQGTSPLKVVWRKGRDEIKHSHQCCIESTNTISALTIARSERGDSGCYTLQVSKSAAVRGLTNIPDPPGKPFPENMTGDGMIVSWYGSGFDGGSPITSYLLEISKNSSSGRKAWSEVASTNSTSYTVAGLENNAAYVFRVSASNQYGTSQPGPLSDILRNTSPVQENGADSSDDEGKGEEFVEYEPVSIKKEKFSAKYEVREKLGQGRFGKVHRVTDRVSGREFAAKIMRALKSRDREAVSMEIDIMNQLRHPKLVQLIDAYSHGREIIMVMDLVAGGELFERVIDEDFELTEAACIKYMRQICHGVQFMERSQIVHLDLKPENIMCINKTGTQIKLIDFGLARKFNPKEVTRVMFGTPEFVAPEVINYDAIGFETDMWSVGVICYILLSGLSPFCGEGDAETLSNITAVQWDFEDEAFDQISDDAKDFISKLLVKGLKKRYNVNQALDHRWLKRDTNKMSKSKLNTKNLKRYLARRKWQKTGNAVRALGRLASLARLSSSSSSSSSSHGNQRESGFLSSLKAQLIRENETQQVRCFVGHHKPEFLRKFDDIEVIEGSAAKFVCTVSGNPDPDIVWLVDGEPIKESRRFRMAYTEDNQCTLLIMDASEADEAEYTCKASNSMGESQHAAELIVIT
uniref:Myosin light chain kinase, smooth muscle n=1 Tax=Ciona savignyi TaxID=51511 RepID=H2YHI4_CIOSA